jgi:hypothetical protein
MSSIATSPIGKGTNLEVGEQATCWRLGTTSIQRTICAPTNIVNNDINI